MARLPRPAVPLLLALCLAPWPAGAAEEAAERASREESPETPTAAGAAQELPPPEPLQPVAWPPPEPTPNDTAPAATTAPATGAARSPSIRPIAVRPPAPVAGSVVAPVRPRRHATGSSGVVELGMAPAAAGRWRGTPISMSLRDAPLPEVLRTFAKAAGVNLVLDPRVQGLVTVELENVPWDQALYVILKTHGMAAEIDGRVRLVTPD